MGVEVLLWGAAERLMRLDRRLLCRVPHAGDAVFLTFDDGPDPEATPRVLDLLGTHGAKATFFLIGRNAERHPELLERIRREGHAVGDHTWDHADAWRVRHTDFLHSHARGHAVTGATLFRPPYGHITPRMVRQLHPTHRIVLWDVLAGDFKPRMDGTRIARRVVRASRPGSIVVFHDTERCWPKLGTALPLVLKGLAERGLRAKALTA
jgi:peptidoglycan-N-acetylglucosamine deacetylase